MLTQSKMLNDAHCVAISDFRDRHKKSYEQFLRAGASMPGGNTRSVLYYAPFPLTMTHGKGASLWDMDGHHYVDFLGEFTAAIFGHSHPRIFAALTKAMETGLNLSSHTCGEADLANELCKRFPTFEKLRLTNSGSEANLMAISAARAFTKRNKVVVFAGAYHGGPLSFVGEPSRANVPFDLIIAQYNNLQETIARLSPDANDIAAILVEPMMGAGGCIPANLDFLQGLRDWSAKNGVLLIFDEVMTSRLHPNGLQTALEIKPDLTTMGKYLGGGMSIGVFGGRADIMAQFDPSQNGYLPHAGTFNNNVMTMQAGLAGLREIYTENEAVRLTQMGDDFRHRLNELCTASGLPVHFTGLGSIMNLHSQAGTVTKPEQVFFENKQLKELIFFGLLQRGFLIAKRGFIALNICLEDTHLAAFEQAFSDTLTEIGPCILKTLPSGENHDG